MSKNPCPFEKDCYNADCEFLCEHCDRTEKTFKLTDPERIKADIDEYLEWCENCAKTARKEDEGDDYWGVAKLTEEGR